MNRRRQLKALLAAACAAPLYSLAQTGTAARRIGVLMSSNESLAGPLLQSFISGLADHGYVAGKNLTIDVRFADGDLGRLPALAAQLIALKPDVLAGIEAPALALRALTKTIPIVLIAGGNPVTSGLVQSLARPGTNVTGTSLMLDELTGKHVELLAEMVPKMTRVALLYYDAPSGDGLAALARQAEASARAVATAKRLTLTPAGAHDATSLQRAFGQIESARAQGVVYVAAGGLLPLRDAILAHCLRLRLPSISAALGWADAGGLLAYGANFSDTYRYSAKFAARIFKGTRPADLPVEQTREFEMALNLKTARALGLPVPGSMMVRAQRLIE